MFFRLLGKAPALLFSGRRKPKALSGERLRTSRAVARRADLFVDSQVDEVEDQDYTTDIRCGPGRHAGSIQWAITEANGAPLDSHALSLFRALTELYLQGPTKKIAMKSGEVRVVVSVTPKKLIEMVYGRGHHAKDEYALLGLMRDQTAKGGLQRLYGVSIRKASSWINWTGKKVEAHEDFRLVDWTRWRKVGTQEHIQIALGSPVQVELTNGGLALLPAKLIQSLGPNKGIALRVATYVLALDPLYGDHREIGLTGLAAIIHPDPNRDPARYPGRFRGYVQRLLNQIGAADPDHIWSIETAKTDPAGKCVCGPNHALTAAQMPPTPDGDRD